MSDDQHYVSPLSERYASREMSYLFSPYYKTVLFRKLWIALATAEKKLGLPIKASQIAEMKKKAGQVDLESVARHEAKLHHDVMAHIHAFADLCPTAKPILHLGATSAFITDNAELIQAREGLNMLRKKLTKVVGKLSSFAKRYAASPTLSYTHFQSAQPTTIGKRACLWLQDFLMDAASFEGLYEGLPFLGAKGTTGTQASFLALLGSKTKVKQLDVMIAKTFGFTKVLPIAGQTYTRKLDANLLNAFASFAASAHKFATDLRLLAHEGELMEVFGKDQVGSSAMPYKRNPIYAERVCGIARFVISLAQNPLYTTATQWLERSLDDSSNRRLTIPEAFLSMDALLDLLYRLVSSMRASPQVALFHLKEKLPFLCMENILMEAVKKGGNRQDLHEKLRKLSFKKGWNLEDLLKEVEKDKAFHLSKKELRGLCEISCLIGLSADQTTDYLQEVVRPFLSR